MAKRTQSVFALPALSLLASAAALFITASPAQAQSARADYQREALTTGAVWESDSIGIDHKVEGFGAHPVRLHAALERDERPMGEARRAYAQAGVELRPGTALEIGGGTGAGAVYSWRSAAHVTAYQAVGRLELSATFARLRYIDSTLQRTSLNARMPVGLGVTGILGLSSSRTQGRVAGTVTQFGLERSVSACVVSGAAYFGRELLAPEVPTSQLLKSKAYLLKARCPVSPRVDVEFSASTSRAEQLSRQGVAGALVFSY